LSTSVAAAGRFCERRGGAESVLSGVLSGSDRRTAGITSDAPDGRAPFSSPAQPRNDAVSTVISSGKSCRSPAGTLWSRRIFMPPSSHRSWRRLRTPPRRPCGQDQD
jgi:hypothetical protein